MIELVPVPCPSCHASGKNKWGSNCYLCSGEGCVNPYLMSRQCPKCRTSKGYFKKSGPQSVVHCATDNCWNHVYNASKAETGEPQRTIRSRPNLPGGARDFVLNRANFRCELCGRGAEHGIFLDIAHALSVADCKAQEVPEAQWHDYSNLLAACEECNHDMGSRSLEPRQMMRLLIARLRRGKQR